MQEHAVCALNLSVHSGVRNGCPIDPDVLLIIESNEFTAGELCAIVCDDGVRYSEAMDDIGKTSTACSDLIVEIDRASIHFINLSMVTSRWVKPTGAFLSGPTRSSPQTAKGHK